MWFESWMVTLSLQEKQVAQVVVEAPPIYIGGYIGSCAVAFCERLPLAGARTMLPVRLGFEPRACGGRVHVHARSSRRHSRLHQRSFHNVLLLLRSQRHVRVPPLASCWLASFTAILHSYYSTPAARLILSAILG